jgi:hypothetical protein
VTDPPNDPLILYGTRLNNVLVHELAVEEAQEPTTVGSASSSSSPGDLQPAGHPSDDVHQYGADQPAYQSPEEQFHEIPSLINLHGKNLWWTATLLPQRDLNSLLILSQRFVSGDGNLTLYATIGLNQ